MDSHRFIKKIFMAPSNKVITIDPRCKFVYASMYLQGLNEYFGHGSVRFGIIPFRKLEQKSGTWDFDHYMAFHLAPNDIRFIIDYGDKRGLNSSALNWCDIYAKVNLNELEISNITDAVRKKIVHIGPSFGVNNHSLFSLYSSFMLNRIKSSFMKGGGPNSRIPYRL